MQKDKIISVLLVIIWMTFIFIMSSFDGSSSTNQSNIIVNFIQELFNIKNVEIISLIIRKLAHFTEYLILAILVSNMLKVYDKKLWFALIICILYAMMDEYHQTFVSGRSGNLIDVLIDSIGSINGYGIYNLIVYYKNKLIR